MSRLHVLACLPLALWAADRKPPVRKAAPETAPAITRTLSLPVSLPAASGPAINGQCVVSTGPALPLSALAFHPEGKLLAVGGYREVLVWDLENARLARRLGADALAGQVRAVAFLPGGQSLAVAEGVPGSSGHVRLLDFEGGKITATLDSSKDEVLALAVSPDGKFLAAGGTDNQVRVWELPGGKLATTLKDHSDWVSGVAFSGDGKFLASASADRTSNVWEVGAWTKLVNLPPVVTEPVRGVAFSPDSDIMVFAVGGEDDRAVRIWRTEVVRPPEQETEAARARRKSLLQNTRPASTGAGIPFGVGFGVVAGTQPLASRVRMYVPCSDKTIKVMNATGGVLATLSGHQDWVYAAVLSPDGTRLATSGADGTVKLWSGTDNALWATLVQMAPRGDDWLIVTPRGFHAWSSPKDVEWKAADGKPVAPEIIQKLEQAGMVKAALAGLKAPPPARK